MLTLRQSTNLNSQLNSSKRPFKLIMQQSPNSTIQLINLIQKVSTQKLQSIRHKSNHLRQTWIRPKLQSPSLKIRSLTKRCLLKHMEAQPLRLPQGQRHKSKQIGTNLLLSRNRLMSFRQISTLLKQPLARLKMK